MITTKQGTKIQLNTIEEAIADIKQGKVIIVVDDEDRENEGDFVAAAENITPEIINFMATHGRGLICTPITESRCKELQLEMMVGNNTDPMETAFTISIDLKGHGVTTGISAKDRAKTVKALVDPSIKPFDLSRPGHIFPLKAKDEGVLRRAGHTEASVDLARLAGFEPAGIIVEIMNEDGSMARLPQLLEIAKKFDLKIVSIKDLIEIANAGHQPALLKNGKEFKEFPSSSMPLAVTKHKDESVYQLESFKLNGGRIYCFTDGFSECMDDKKQEIGIEGVKELLLKHENVSLKKELEDATEEIRLKSLKIDIKEKGIKENNDILDDDLTIIGIGK